MPLHEVIVGDKNYTIERFRGLKALLAIASVTRIGREVPSILANAVKEYKEKNKIEVTEAMTGLPTFSGFSKEDFDAAEKRTGHRVIELPAPMDPNEQILQALPELLTEARKEVIRLFAILLVPNSELKTADRENKVESVLDEYYDLILDAEIDQLADIMLITQEVINEQIGSRGDKLGNLFRGLRGLLRGPSTPQTPTLTETATKEKSLISPTSTSGSQSSSIASPAPTDGTEKQSSSEPVGVS